MFAIATQTQGLEPMLHEWSEDELELMDKLTDPELPRQYCRHLQSDDKSWGYCLIEVTPEQVAAEVTQREQDQADQRAHSWAM